MSIASILFIASLSIHLARLELKLLVTLGAASMAIYLMHILMGSGARILVLRVLHSDSPSIHLVVGMAAGLMMTLLVHTMATSTSLNVLFAIPRRLSVEAFLSPSSK